MFVYCLLCLLCTLAYLLAIFHRRNVFLLGFAVLNPTYKIVTVGWVERSEAQQLLGKIKTSLSKLAISFAIVTCPTF